MGGTGGGGGKGVPGVTNVLNHSFENATLLDRLPYRYLQITWRFQHKERNFVSQS